MTPGSCWTWLWSECWGARHYVYTDSWVNCVNEISSNLTLRYVCNRFPPCEKFLPFLGLDSSHVKDDCHTRLGADGRGHITSSLALLSTIVLIATDAAEYPPLVARHNASQYSLIHAPSSDSSSLPNHRLHNSHTQPPTSTSKD